MAIRFGATALALLVDGIAYAMILFLMSVGLTVTMGVMRVANLAHCGFAMIGGYLGWTLVTEAKLDVLPALAVSAAATMALGALLERTVYRWVYATGELGQILMTLGLTFVMVAAVNLVWGSDLHAMPLSLAMTRDLHLGPISINRYRLFIIAVSIVIAAALWTILEYTNYGARPSTTRAWRAASASMSPACSRAPSPSAAGLPPRPGSSAARSCRSSRIMRSSISYPC